MNAHDRRFSLDIPILALLALLLSVTRSAATVNWEFTAPLGTARDSHTAVLLENGQILVQGGAGASGALGSVELYDPIARTWSQAGMTMALARAKHTATKLANGKVLAAGGSTAGPSSTDSAELFDPATKSTVLTGTMNVARRSHAATLLANGKVLVSGGITGNATVLNSAEYYDPASGTWSRTGFVVYAPYPIFIERTMATERQGHTATLLDDGRVLVAGGQVGSGTRLATAELYDPAAGTWTSTGSMLMARTGHTATLLKSGHVLVVGGWGIAGWGTWLNSAELYDPATGNWTSTGPLGQARCWHQATLLPGDNGAVLVTGGRGNNGGAPLKTTEMYDPLSGTWSYGPEMNYDRFGHSAAGLKNGQVVVLGGDSASAVLASAEVFTFPPNRECSSARVLNDNVYFAQNTVGASENASSWCLGPVNVKGLWFSYTPMVAGIATVDTCPSDFDTALEVFTGTCVAVNSVTCNNGSTLCNPATRARVDFACTAGTTYLIYAGGLNGQSGTLQIRVALAPSIPTPTITIGDPNVSPLTLTLGWQGNGYDLEEAQTLPAWGPSDAGISVLGGSCTATDSSVGTTRFYRLRDNSQNPPAYGNPVGYIGLAVPGGVSMRCNPFQRVSPTSNRLNDLFKLESKYKGTTIFKFTMTGGWENSTFYGTTWSPNLTLGLGEGVFIATAGGAPLLMHMAGPLSHAKPAVYIPAGIAVIGPPWPVDKDVAALNYPAAEWAWIFRLNGWFVPHTHVLGFWWRWDWNASATPPAWVPVPFVVPAASFCESFLSWRSDTVDWVCPMPATLP